MTVLDEIAPIDPGVELVGKEASAEKFRTKFGYVALAARWLVRFASIAILLWVLWSIVKMDFSDKEGENQSFFLGYILLVGNPLWMPVLFSWWGQFKPALQLLSLIYLMLFFSPFLYAEQDELFLTMSFGALFVGPIFTIVYAVIATICWRRNFEEFKRMLDIG